jgi:CheY-like chemotaxis protein
LPARALPARALPARVLPARVLPARVLPARVLPARVLIVEDECLIALNLRQLLEDMGVDQVDWAADLETAVRLIGAGPPDFAILDIDIGGALVFAFAAALRARGIAFVFSSGRNWRDQPAEFGRDRFAPKLLDAEALSAIWSSLDFADGAPQYAA